MKDHINLGELKKLGKGTHKKFMLKQKQIMFLARVLREICLECFLPTNLRYKVGLANETTRKNKIPIIWPIK